MKEYNSEELELLKLNTTTVVHTLIVMWLKIRKELGKHNRSKALRMVILGKYKEEDKILSKDFYNKFKQDKLDGKYIVWNDSYFDYYSSIMLYIEKNDISFGFPYNCRQWPQSNLIDRIISEILNNKGVSVFNLEKFLILWTKLRLSTSVKLAGSDITIINYLTRRRKPDDYMKFEQEKKIAKDCGMSNTNVSYRLRRLSSANIFFWSYICNIGKIGFTSFISTEEIKEIDKFCLVKLPFTNFRLMVYQTPQEWIQNEEKIVILKEFEFGYSTGCLRPEGRTNHHIERSYFDKVHKSSYHKYKIDLISEISITNEKELNLLGFYSPMGYQLSHRISDLASQLQVSETSVRNLFKNLIDNRLVYNFIDLHFLGFYKYIGIIVKGNMDKISKLTSYLRQYFHYRVFIGEEISFIHLRISPLQYNQLSEEIELIKNDFELFEICIFENDKNSYVKRSIDFKNASWSIDDFMGLKWETRNIELKENRLE